MWIWVITCAVLCSNHFLTSSKIHKENHNIHNIIYNQYIQSIYTDCKLLRLELAAVSIIIVTGEQRDGWRGEKGVSGRDENGVDVRQSDFK